MCEIPLGHTDKHNQTDREKQETDSQSAAFECPRNLVKSERERKFGRSLQGFEDIQTLHERLHEGSMASGEVKR